MKPFVIAILFSGIMIAYDFIWGYGNRSDTYCQNQFQRAISMANGTCPYSSLAEPSFIEKGTLLHYFPAYVLYRTVYSKNKKERDNYVPEYTFHEKQLLDSIIDSDNIKTEITANNNLVLFLVESLESWVINSADEKGNQLAPVLSDLVKKDNVLYASKLKSQAKQGSSGEGR